MSDHSAGPTMHQKIFSMNLAVGTVSLYLLCCALADAGAVITVDALADKWNGDPASLRQALADLEARRIIRRTPGDGRSPADYRVLNEDQWS